MHHKRTSNPLHNTILKGREEALLGQLEARGCESPSLKVNGNFNRIIVSVFQRVWCASPCAGGVVHRLAPHADKWCVEKGPGSIQVPIKIESSMFCSILCGRSSPLAVRLDYSRGMEGSLGLQPHTGQNIGLRIGGSFAFELAR